MEIKLPDIKLSKREQKNLNDRFKEMLIDALSEDAGWEYVDEAIKLSKPKIVAEIKRILDEDYKSIALRIVTKALKL